MRSQNTSPLKAIVWFAVIVVSMQLRAESAICEWAGYSTMHEAIAVYGDLPSAVGGEAQKSSLVQHSTLRAVLVIERCPVSAEKALSEKPGLTKQWLSSVSFVLGPYFTGELSWDDIDRVAHRIACSDNLPIVCKVKRLLLTFSNDLGRKHKIGDTDHRLGFILVAEAATELANSSGDFVTPMGDLAFLLATCPDVFFAYMHEHPKDLDNWIETARDSIFWGDPKDEVILEAYKAELVGFVAQTPTEYTAEREKILRTIKEASVRATQ